jgi:hypothetical protein
MLQGWSKQTGGQRITGLCFLLAFAAAAVWGSRFLLHLR